MTLAITWTMLSVLAIGLGVWTLVAPRTMTRFYERFGRRGVSPRVMALIIGCIWVAIGLGALAGAVFNWIVRR